MSTASIDAIAEGSITSTPGFQAAGIACGLKGEGALDLALVYSPAPCSAAAVFTTNAFKAAPVLYDQAILARNATDQRAVVINTRCANACTGAHGRRDAEAMAVAASRSLGIPVQSVLVMSTGVIGLAMPMDKILPGVSQACGALSHTREAGHAAARAIMTTDTRPKECAVLVRSSLGSCTIAGMAKGSGMIHPNMATMLCLVTTDASIAPALLQRALNAAVQPSFNSITVDGDTSTNDTVLVLANATAQIDSTSDESGPAYAAFVAGLERVLTQLAQAVVRDGEGATRFVAITVQGARNSDEARKVAKSVANSPLVKTAIYGRDANWGRIVCAVGYSGVPVAPARVSVWLGDLALVRNGEPDAAALGTEFEERARQILERSDVSICIDLASGSARATVWTCDLSHRYVDINAHYRT